MRQFIAGLLLGVVLSVLAPAIAQYNEKPLAKRVHEAVSTVAPINGVSLGNEKDKSTWKVDFKPEATARQKSDAQTEINNFDENSKDPAAEAKKSAYANLKTKAASPGAANTDFVEAMRQAALSGCFDP